MKWVLCQLALSYQHPYYSVWYILADIQRTQNHMDLLTYFVTASNTSHEKLASWKQNNFPLFFRKSFSFLYMMLGAKAEEIATKIIPVVRGKQKLITLTKSSGISEVLMLSTRNSNDVVAMISRSLPCYFNL